MRITRVLVVTGVFLLLMPLAHAADETGFILRFGLAYVCPTGDLDVTLPGGDTPGTLEFDSVTGLFVGLEYKFTALIGLDVNLLYSSPNVTIEGDGRSEEGDGTFLPLSLGANFHLTQNKKADFYIGPMLAYVTYDKVEFDDLTEDLDSDFGYGANLGVDVPFGEKWDFDAGLKYLQTKAKSSEEGNELDVNPWIVQAGVGYRF